jgi:hypothetical protein
MSDGADVATTELIGPGLARRGAARVRLSLPELRPQTRALAFATATWLPLALLAALEGRFTSPGCSFAHDVASYVRFLWVGPLLVALGLPFDRELAGAVSSWRTSPLVTAAHLAIFDRFLARLYALRRSPLPDLVLLGLAYLLTVLALRGPVRWHIQTWMFTGRPPGSLSLAGWWWVLVSAPLLVHALLRWLWRFGIWSAALLRLATLPAPVLGTHPDGAGGLDRVARLHNLFTVEVVALSSFAAGGLANLGLHTAAGVGDLRRAAGVTGALLLLVFLAPLVFFTPRLITGKRRTLARYGAVAAHHALYLERQIDVALAADPRDLPRLSDDLLENDANLAQSFATVIGMRVLLIDRTNALLFAAAAVLPLLLVELTRMPAKELLGALKDAFM